MTDDDAEHAAGPTLVVGADAEEAARRAARLIAETLRAAVRARGGASLAVSGGATPWRMLGCLAWEDVPWSATHLFQVDERVVPADDPRRNATRIREALAERAAPGALQFHPLPVEDDDAEAACRDHARRLALAGTPPRLDLVHLGLGDDGHTASLFPGDAALDADGVVAVTGIHEGTRRMTLTLPTINAARMVLWLVTGANKAGPLADLLQGHRPTPANRVARAHAVVVADAAAAGRA